MMMVLYAEWSRYRPDIGIVYSQPGRFCLERGFRRSFLALIEGTYARANQLEDGYQPIVLPEPTSDFGHLRSFGERLG